MVGHTNNQSVGKHNGPYPNVVQRPQGRNEPVLCFTSFLGDNAIGLYGQVVAYLSRATGLATELVLGLSPSEQEVRVNQASIQVVFTCGLPYVHKADHNPPLLRLIAAPVLAAERYQDRPIYFADVIVHRDSPFRTFESLRGTTIVYNEVHSLSGYLAVCHYLLTRGDRHGFFGHAVQSGAHAVSMDWVEQRRVDSAAIDSVVLEMELAQRPERANVFRVVQQIGPFPMPPVAAIAGLEDDICRRLREALLQMHEDARGRAVLHTAGIRRFAPVVDRDYDPIRQVVRQLERITMVKLD